MNGGFVPRQSHIFQPIYTSPHLCFHCGYTESVHPTALEKEVEELGHSIMTTKELGQAARANAVDKGFYRQITELLDHPVLTPEQKNFIRYLWRSNRLMLMVSELGEALEGLRHNNLSAVPKSGGVREELSDLHIRLVDFEEDEGWDLMSDSALKHEYNTGRPYMHGGKVA